MSDNHKKICIIVPTYNNSKTLSRLISELKLYPYPIIVVNDGSTDSTALILSSIDDIIICSNSKNKGKGHALQIGFKKAHILGFEYCITIDSDGQHHPEEIASLINKSNEHPSAIIIGSRNLNAKNMPGKNTFANKFSNFWFKIETGLEMEDTQSGFRLYPLNAILNRQFYTRHYDFELEVLVRSAWGNIPIIPIPVKVTYLPVSEQISHFKPVLDFTRISLLNTVLVIIAFFWVKPAKLIKKLNSKSLKTFLKEKIFSTNDSNRKIALSIMLGIFTGMSPMWGYQMLIAYTLAHFFKLNKVVALVSANISIPPMIPFILYGGYYTGARIFGNTPYLLDINFDTVKQNLLQYLIGSVVFGAFCAITSGLICYCLLNVFRKKAKG